MANLSDQPFTVTSEDDAVTITMHPSVCERPDLLTRAGYEWIRELKGHIQVNFSQLQQVNSSLVAWLFQLVQWGSGPVELAHANQRIRRQLKQFHMQHFITFPMDDIDSSAVLPGTR